MSETRVSTIAAGAEDVRPLSTGLAQAVGDGLRQVARWAGNTAQQLGELLGALMGPAIVCSYAYALWSLAQNLGWTNSFVFQSGPFSNFFVWLAVASLISLAAAILGRRTQTGRSA